MVANNPAPKGKGKEKASAKRDVVPDIYQEMLAEALPSQADSPERPLKKRRTGTRAPGEQSGSKELVEIDDEELEFEDVLAESDDPPKTRQTAYRDLDEESADDDLDWEGIDFGTLPQDSVPTGDLELTLTSNQTPQRQRVSVTRKVVSKAERGLRLEIHKMHLLCLLSHLDRRNNWCNDPEVHATLKPLLDKKMLTFLRPKSNLSQFGQAESLKRGLEQVSLMWRNKYRITARGIRRALWAYDEQDLQDVSILCKVYWQYRS